MEWLPTNCLDSDGAIWTQPADTRTYTGRPESPAGTCVRVREGGEVLYRIEHDRPIFAAMLGGPDRRSLFLLAAEWRGVDKVDEVIAGRTGRHGSARCRRWSALTPVTINFRNASWPY